MAQPSVESPAEVMLTSHSSNESESVSENSAEFTVEVSEQALYTWLFSPLQRTNRTAEIKSLTLI